VISVTRREVNEDFALLGYYAARSGKFLSTFRDKLWVPRFNLADGPGIFCRSVGKELPLLAA